MVRRHATPAAADATSCVTTGGLHLGLLSAESPVDVAAGSLVGAYSLLVLLQEQGGRKCDARRPATMEVTVADDSELGSGQVRRLSCRVCSGTRQGPRTVNVYSSCR